VKSIVTVSVETVAIVKALPSLELAELVKYRTNAGILADLHAEIDGNSISREQVVEAKSNARAELEAR
jgi:hypothetical protein